MITRKLFGGTAIIVASFALTTPAFAGELTGGGPDGQRPTPIVDYVANSVCAFSGLEDGDGTGVGPGVTQTWGGSLLSETNGGQDIAAAAQAGILQSFGPGQNCRGFPSGGSS